MGGRCDTALRGILVLNIGIPKSHEFSIWDIYKINVFWGPNTKALLDKQAYFYHNTVDSIRSYLESCLKFWL